MIIQHNLPAANTSKSLGISNQKKSKSMERLASGYKINQAADDAAGLKISEKMRSQIRGLNQASDNIETGEDYVKVADGALAEVTEILQRIRVLSVQASNDATLCVEDKQAIQDEISQLKDEIECIFNDTEFNHRKIWRQPTQWHHNELSAATRESAITMKVPYYSRTINNTNRGAVPRTDYALSATDEGVTVSWTGYNGKRYVSDLIPYKDGDPKKGLVDDNDLDNYLNKTTYPDLIDGFHMTVAYDANPNATVEQVIAGLNQVTISSHFNSSELTTMYNSSGGIISNFGSERLSASVSIEYPAELRWDRDMEEGDTSFIQGSSSGTLTNLNMHIPTSNSDSWRLTFTLTDNTGNSQEISSTPGIRYYCGDRSDAAENVWWRWEKDSRGTPYKSGLSYSVGSTQGGFRSAVENTAGHNLLTNTSSTGTIEMTFNLSDSTGNVGRITVTVGTNPSADSASSVLNRIRSLYGIDVYNYASNNADGVGLSYNSTFGAYGNQSNYNQFEIPAVIEHSAEDIRLNIQSGANPWERIELRYKYLDNMILGIDNLEVDTYEHAQKTLQACDDALVIVLGERARFGAYQNRFEHARAVNDITAENTQAAESIIRDTDMASEMVKFAKENILENAGMSLLTQANRNPERVLELLK